MERIVPVRRNKTTTAAFSNAGVYQGDTGTMTRDIAPGETTVVNLTGKEVFVDGENSFQVLADLKTALNNNDGATVRALLPRLDNALNQLLKLEAELGSEAKRVETTLERLDELEVNLMDRISTNDDTDMPRALVTCKTPTPFTRPRSKRPPPCLRQPCWTSCNDRP
jgi:flagellar hook-associated protein 3 FlgL